jgi:hypothetical protein
MTISVDKSPFMDMESLRKKLLSNEHGKIELKLVEVIMVNIFGIILSFLGTIITLLGILSSKPNEGTEGNLSWNEFDSLGTDKAENKKFTVCGLIVMGIGFLFQLVAALLAL